MLLDLETDPDIRVLGTYKKYYERLEKRLRYLHKVFEDFKAKCLVLLNKDCEFFQYNGGELVYLISPLCCVTQNSSKRIIGILV